MVDAFAAFERITRLASTLTSEVSDRGAVEHPFESRNIHPNLPGIVKQLFDDGHYAQATFEAFKFVDKEVARLSKSSESGFKLMMAAFAAETPQLKLTACNSSSEKDEQKGYQFLFAGSVLAIRNPRGHEYAIRDSPDECLDHLGLASILLRRIEAAGMTLSV